MLQPVWATVLLCTLLAACPGRSGNAHNGPAISEVKPQPNEPHLRYDGQTLQYESGAGSVQFLRATDCVPYRMVPAGDIMLVTLLRDSPAAGPHPLTAVLRPSSSGALETVQVYRDSLPSVVAPPLVALTALPNPLTGLTGETIYWKGEQLFPDSSPDLAGGQPHTLLRPAADTVTTWAHPHILLVQFNPHELIRPFGSTLQLLLLHPNREQPYETVELQLRSQATDVELLVQTHSHALLLLQYDFEEFEFVSLALEPPQVIGRWDLHGQPLSRTLYPGPGYDYPGLSENGNTVSLAVVPRTGTSERWIFDLAEGSRGIEPFTEHHPAATDLPQQRLGAPYPQDILPTGGRPPWTIPALLDGAGRVLVTKSDGRLIWFEVP